MYLPDTPKLCVLMMQLYEAEVKDEGDLLIPGCPSPWQCQILPMFGSSGFLHTMKTQLYQCRFHLFHWIGRPDIVFLAPFLPFTFLTLLTPYLLKEPQVRVPGNIRTAPRSCNQSGHWPHFFFPLEKKLSWHSCPSNSSYPYQLAARPKKKKVKCCCPSC